MRILSKIALLTCAIILAACGQTEPASEAGSTPAHVAARDAVPGPEAVPATGIWFEPRGLSACGSGKDVVRVHWDVTSTPDVTAVEVVPIEKGVPAGVFATAGAQGSKDTGPWMHAGGTMAVLNATNGEELARASVDSIPCAD